ncbi:flagellar protein FlaG [Kiloniella antarctica]|uniref:Flagellar protein FlaG n=1 Tax=Kiloniella antarctica TaxID=1550907 RepID=A0ABW5BT12_9PROT
MSDLTIQNQPARSVPKVSNSAPVQAVTSQTLPAKAASSSGALGLDNLNRTLSGGASALNSPADSNVIKDGASAKAGGNGSSNIMTYRDSDSGRLVVRVVDENSNAVISEFPSKTMLGNYPKIVPSSVTPDVDTKV